MKYECGYCGKYVNDPKHLDLEELRAELVRAIYYIEAELTRSCHSPRMFLDSEMLKRYRKRLKKVNKELEKLNESE